MVYRKTVSGHGKRHSLAIKEIDGSLSTEKCYFQKQNGHVWAPTHKLPKMSKISRKNGHIHCVRLTHSKLEFFQGKKPGSCTDRKAS